MRDPGKIRYMWKPVFNESEIDKMSSKFRKICRQKLVLFNSESLATISLSVVMICLLTRYPQSVNAGKDTIKVWLQAAVYKIYWIYMLCPFITVRGGEHFGKEVFPVKRFAINHVIM